MSQILPESFAPDRPYKISRIVGWGDCDPAGIVYTPRFLDWSMEAAEGFWRDIIGADWYALRTQHGMGSPSVSIHMEFQKPLAAGESFDVEVRIPKLSRATITFALTGRNKAGESCFTTELVSCVIDAKAFRSATIPDKFREPVARYIAATASSAPGDTAA